MSENEFKTNKESKRKTVHFPDQNQNVQFYTLLAKISFVIISHLSILSNIGLGLLNFGRLRWAY